MLKSWGLLNKLLYASDLLCTPLYLDNQSSPLIYTSSASFRQSGAVPEKGRGPSQATSDDYLYDSELSHEDYYYDIEEFPEVVTETDPMSDKVEEFDLTDMELFDLYDDIIQEIESEKSAAVGDSAGLKLTAKRSSTTHPPTQPSRKSIRAKSDSSYASR